MTALRQPASQHIPTSTRTRTPVRAPLRAMMIRRERAMDIAAREALLDAALGPCRRTKSSERLREGRSPAEGLSFVATENGRLIGTVRLWHITAGVGGAALLLGPLAVDADSRSRGIGGALLEHALRQARNAGAAAVLLVGDAAYYNRFGFSAKKTGALRMQGRTDADRLLALELVPGALDGARGEITAGKRPPRQPGVSAPAAALRQAA